jgi:hypothetical protein
MIDVMPGRRRAAAAALAGAIALLAGAPHPAAPGGPLTGTSEAPLAAAGSLAGLVLPDQHGATHPLPPGTRTVVFVADMDATTIVHALLGERAPDYLDARRAVFIADIHRMPRIITRFVALPRMRRYPYRMLLIRDDTTGARFPRRAEHVTVLGLDEALRPAWTRYVTTAAELERALLAGAAAGEPPAPPPGAEARPTPAPPG